MSNNNNSLVDRTPGDTLRILAANPEVIKARAQYLSLIEHVGVKFQDEEGFWIKDKEQPGFLKKIRWWGKTEVD